MLSPDTAFDLLTVKDAACLLKCSKAHVCNLAAGRVSGCLPLPAIRMGRRMLIRREALDKWLRESETAVRKTA
jgi:excisionase family DNA binding protein